MGLYLGLGAAVVIAIIAAFFVLRSARSRDDDSGADSEPVPGRRRMAREPDEDWSIDDYRSPHPIRGKYATPTGGRAPAGPGGMSPGGPGGPGPGGPGMNGGPMSPGGASRAPGGAAGRGYPGAPGGYTPAPTGPGAPGAPAGPGAYGQGAPPRAARGEWQPGYPPADPGGHAEDGGYPDEEPAPEDGKKKGRGKRFRLGRREEEADIWPDDGVSDEDYWASVSSERSLPNTDGARGGSPFPPAAAPTGGTPASGRPGGGPRLPPMVTPVTARPQATPRPAAGLAMPSATPSGATGPGTPPGMNGGAGGPSGPQRQGPPQPPGAGRYGAPPSARGARPEPNGYPDPRDLRPSARPPTRQAPDRSAPDRQAPDRYQNEQTETFSMPDGPPTAQPPARGGGRHSRRPDERGRSPYPYGQPEDEDPGHRRR
jgi:hypothetical protein